MSKMRRLLDRSPRFVQRDSLVKPKFSSQPIIRLLIVVQSRRLDSDQTLIPKVAVEFLVFAVEQIGNRHARPPSQVCCLDNDRGRTAKSACDR